MISNEDAELAKIARELRSAFIAQKEKLSNKKYRPNKRFESVDCWLKTAKVVKRLKAVPEEYIRAQFMYSLGTVFANTLHGPVAQNRYKDFAQSNRINTSSSDETSDTTLSADTALFIESIHQTEDILKEKFGPHFKLTKDSITEFPVKSEILSTWWRFDPVVIMAFAGKDPDYRKKFILSASKELVESPYLIRAAASLGLDLMCNSNEEEFTDN